MFKGPLEKIAFQYITIDCHVFNAQSAPEFANNFFNIHAMSSFEWYYLVITTTVTRKGLVLTQPIRNLVPRAFSFFVGRRPGNQVGVEGPHLRSAKSI